ncbi:MAG: DUF4340 domain-containing protein [Planctomycetota bacterium JB042]
MNLRTTLLLLVVVGVLGALALKYGGEREETTLPGTGMLVQDLPGGKVTSFDVLLASRQDGTFERRGDEWWITSPYVDRASPDAVRMLMEALKSNPRLEIDANADRSTLEAVGLEPPKTRVTLRGTEGDPIGIRLGERDASGAYTHARIEGDPALYRTGANLVNVLAKGLHEWRDARFLTGDAALLRRLELKRPGEPRVVLERPGTEWQLVEPSAFKADKSVAGPLVHGLLLLRVDRFVQNTPQEKDLLERGISAETAIEVTLDWGARRVTARFGPPEGAVEGGRRFAVDSERGHLFLVEGEALGRLETPLERFRDPKVIRVTPQTVERIEFERPGAPTLAVGFDRGERVFRLSSPFEGAVDDSRESVLRSWLLAVSSLEATDYLDRRDLGPAPDGGDPFDALMADRLGVLRLAVADRSGNVRPVELEFADGGGDVYLRSPQLAPDTIYVVERAVADEVLAIDPRELLVLDLFPGELLRWKEATVRLGDRVRRLRRDRTPGAEVWNDPDHPEAETSAFQAALSALEGARAFRILGRDARPEDGLAGDDAIVLELGIAGEDGTLRSFVVRLGAADPTGETVVGAASGALSPFPPRTVFRVEAWMKEQLRALFP